MERILIQLTDEQLSALRSIAAKEGAPVAWQIREAVDKYLKKKK
jgi:predicted DNA binding CopG/RHH family protein